MSGDSPSSQRSNDSGQASTPKNSITTTQRNRENQRLSRARRKEYVASLEAKVRDFERRGANATVEMQKAARDVVKENLMLKEQLANTLCQSCGGKMVGGNNNGTNGESPVAKASVSASPGRTSNVSENSINAEIRRRHIPGIDSMDVDPRDAPSRRMSGVQIQPHPAPQPIAIAPSFSPAAHHHPHPHHPPHPHHLLHHPHAHQPDNLYRLASISSNYSHSSTSSEAAASPAPHASPALSYISNSASNPPPYRQPPVVLPPPQPHHHQYYPSPSHSSNVLPPITDPSASSSSSTHNRSHHGPDISPKSFPAQTAYDRERREQDRHHHHQHGQEYDAITNAGRRNMDANYNRNVANQIPDPAAAAAAPQTPPSIEVSASERSMTNTTTEATSSLVEPKRLQPVACSPAKSRPSSSSATSVNSLLNAPDDARDESRIPTPTPKSYWQDSMAHSTIPSADCRVDNRMVLI